MNAIVGCIGLAIGLVMVGPFSMIAYMCKVPKEVCILLAMLWWLIILLFVAGAPVDANPFAM